MVPTPLGSALAVSLNKARVPVLRLFYKYLLCSTSNCLHITTLNFVRVRISVVIHLLQEDADLYFESSTAG